MEEWPADRMLQVIRGVISVPIPPPIAPLRQNLILTHQAVNYVYEVLVFCRLRRNGFVPCAPDSLFAGLVLRGQL